MYSHQLSRLTSKISSLLWQFFWNREYTNIFSRRTRATLHEFCRILSFFLSKEKAFSNERRFFNWLFEEKRHLRHSTRRLFLTNSRRKTILYLLKIRSNLHRNRRKVSTIETSSISFRCLDHRISLFEIQIFLSFSTSTFWTSNLSSQLLSSLSHQSFYLWSIILWIWVLLWQLFKIKFCSFRELKKFIINESCVIIANFNTRVKSLKNVSTKKNLIFISSIWMTTSTSTKMSRCLREKFNFWTKSRSKSYIYFIFFLFFNFFVFFFAILQKNSTQFVFELFEFDSIFKNNHMIVFCILRQIQFKIFVLILINNDVFVYVFIDKSFAQLHNLFFRFL